MIAKMQRWITSGVRLGWHVWPKTRQVEVWRPGTDQPLESLSVDDSLNGPDVLPGFSYPLARLFGA